MLAPLAVMLFIPALSGAPDCAAHAWRAAEAAAVPVNNSALSDNSIAADFIAGQAQTLYETANYRNMPAYGNYYGRQSAHIIWGGPSSLSHAAFALQPAGIYIMPAREAAVLRAKPVQTAPANAALTIFA